MSIAGCDTGGLGCEIPKCSRGFIDGKFGGVGGDVIVEGLPEVWGLSGPAAAEFLMNGHGGLHFASRSDAVLFPWATIYRVKFAGFRRTREKEAWALLALDRLEEGSIAAVTPDDA